MSRWSPRRGPRPRSLARISVWSAAHPWRAIAVWVLFVAVAVAVGSTVSTRSISDADYRVGQSGRADAEVTRSGLAGPPTESVVVGARRGPLTGAEATAVEQDLRRALRGDSDVARVTPAVASPDGGTRLMTVVMRAPRAGQDVDVSGVQAAVADVAGRHLDLRIAATGDASIDRAVDERVASDLGSAERLSLPVTLLVMIVAFGALVAAGIPVLLALSGVLATIALLAPVSHLVPAESTVSSMVLLVGMAVGVDYSLFYLKRERSERRRGRTPREALDVAAATSGRAIVVSGAAVIVAMAGLYVVGDPTFASLATGAILVVAVSVLGSLTVLPAVLVKLGRWVDRPRIPWLGRRLERRDRHGALTRRLLAPVVRRPGWALLLSVCVVVALALPALGMRLEQSSLESLPRDIPQVSTALALERAFPSQGETLDVVAWSSPGRLPGVVRGLRAVAADAADRPGFERGRTPVRVSRDRTVAMVSLATTGAPRSAAAAAALSTLRTAVVPGHLDGVRGAHWAVGGDAAAAADDAHRQGSKLPWVVGLVLGLTALMMGIRFRSVPVAVLTTLLNLASVSAAFGVLTLVFQHHWAEGLLDFRSAGFVVDWIPLFLFVVLIGLSMDYHVLVLSRVKEKVDLGLSPRAAVEAGVVETAGTVTSAAAVMVSVFAIFATLSLLEMKQIGVGLAVSVLVDATVIRVVMMPAALLLIGRFAWWPARHPRLVCGPPVVAGGAIADGARAAGVTPGGARRPAGAPAPTAARRVGVPGRRRSGDTRQRPGRRLVRWPAGRQPTRRGGTGSARTD